MTYISAFFRNAVLRLVDVPQWTRSKRQASGTMAKVVSLPPPEHVTRLESMFEALSELPAQPHVSAAVELASEALQAELPVEALAAGLYDIDVDEIRFVAANGARCDSLRGTAMPRARCLVGFSAEEAIITSGGPSGAAWIGSGEDGSTVLLCPVLHDGNLLGLLALADPLCAASFSRHDIELVRYVAEQLAAFVHAQRQRSRAARVNAG
jgi:GAF domain-containing protein